MAKLQLMATDPLSQLCEFIQEGFGPCSERIVAALDVTVCGPLVELS